MEKIHLSEIMNTSLWKTTAPTKEDLCVVQGTGTDISGMSGWCTWKGRIQLFCHQQFCGAEAATGEYLVLLNNDTEIRSRETGLEVLLAAVRMPGEYRQQWARRLSVWGSLHPACRSGHWIWRDCRTLFCAAEAGEYRLLPQNHLCPGLQRRDSCLHDGETKRLP